MAYVITDRCIGVKDGACVDVCPVSCIYEGGEQLYIHPGDCIHCGACEPVCPAAAIYPDDEVPSRWERSIAEAAEFFTAHRDPPSATRPKAETP